MLTYANFFEEYNSKIELLKERTKKYFEVKSKEFSVYKEKPFKIALLDISFLSLTNKEFSGFNFVFTEDNIKFKYTEITEDYYEPDIIETFEYDLPLWLLRDDFDELISDLEENIENTNIELKEKEKKLEKNKVEDKEYQQYLKLKQKYEKKGE